MLCVAVEVITVMICAAAWPTSVNTLVAIAAFGILCVADRVGPFTIRILHAPGHTNMARRTDGFAGLFAVRISLAPRFAHTVLTELIWAAFSVCRASLGVWLACSVGANFSTSTVRVNSAFILTGVIEANLMRLAVRIPATFKLRAFVVYTESADSTV